VGTPPPAPGFRKVCLDILSFLRAIFPFSVAELTLLVLRTRSRGCRTETHGFAPPLPDVSSEEEPVFCESDIPCRSAGRRIDFVSPPFPSAAYFIFDGTSCSLLPLRATPDRFTPLQPLTHALHRPPLPPFYQTDLGDNRRFSPSYL